MALLLFWLFLGLVVYTYIGYPAIIGFISPHAPVPFRKDDSFSPSVSVIISVFNEQEYIERKITNILGQNYPQEKIEILIGSDGSIDATDEIVRKYSSRVQLFSFDTRRGKPSILNCLAAKASGEIIVFADARQTFDEHAIRELTARFIDERIGCVSGELFLQGEETSTAGKGLGMYWKYEKLMRLRESAIDSMVGATGAIYAIRRKLFMPIPEDTLLDDMLIPLRIAQSGYRCLFEPRAMAYDRIAQTPAEESRRKVRTLAGNVQLFVTHKKLLNPFSNRLAWQLFSHKVLRVKAPYFLIIIFLSNAFLAVTPGTSAYRAFFLLQVGFYIIAIAGSLLAGRMTGYLSVPRTFCQLNIDAVRGAYAFFFDKSNILWEKQAQK